MRLAFCLPLLGLTAALSAQTQTVIPSAAATAKPTRSPFYTANVFYSTTSTTTAPASRTQTIIDCSDITMPVGLWNAVSFRRPHGLGNNNPAMMPNVTLALSVSQMASSSSTNTFASNHGANPTTVINGMISLPAEANPPAWPAPWQGPFKFSAPYPYVGQNGGSLVVDLTQVQAVGATSWYVEYTTPDVGGRATNGSTPSQCRFSSNTYNNGLGYTTGGLNPNGGTWYVNYSGLLPNVIGIVAISAFGMDNKGIWPLPIDLTPLGAPSCMWYVGLELGFLGALTASATGSARLPNITIPAGLGGTAFYDHTLWFDPAANAAGLVVGWSSKWSIGSGIGAPSAFLYATGNSHTNATGTRVSGACPTFQFLP